ncbi:DNA-processing protein DprA [Halobacillus yeomjeoni]|uniref:DNA-protecting protein DprA n=1 Tax=Halobacillus yeomjeoni TaxID=311194 RepID=A0A931MU90_9BACI|nr:DNA-processing protein DprA [Halobacillus yeomjeoni]MBH0229260.1 DNA-protecting protein DprA [Halobacillus yeomjeoni]
MHSKRERLILLHRAPDMTRPLIRRLLECDPQLESPFDLSPEKFSSQFHIPLKRSAAIVRFIQDPYIMKKLDKKSMDFHCLTLWDQDFPPLLKLIPDPPYVLYAIGDLSLIQNPLSLSVVGTRSPSKFAYPPMKKILSPLIHAGFTIVSGMAEGIDQCAHRLAIDGNGKTIAVLGSGFHHIYPRNDIALYQHMARHQLVISEYPPERPPRKFQFPERNRIISGLTPATFVVEARVKSGSLITVDQALEQGKDVFAMPGLAGLETSEGCHKMINDGATLVHTHEDILEGWVGKI